MKKIGILAFTDRGKALAETLAEQLTGAEMFHQNGMTAKAYLSERFHEKDTFIFICATGIAVRLIAPLIQSKDVDPAVVVMDELGRYIIPILSGHLGGANEAAAELSALTGAEAVLTTATDLNGKFAVDLWTKASGCRIADISKIKLISAAVLREEPVGFCSDFSIEGALPMELTLEPADTGICVSLAGTEKPYKNTLHAVPRIVTLGVGCRKDTDEAVFENFILENLSKQGVAVEAIEQIASIDLKKEEAAILAFSRKYNIPFITYTAEELAAAEGDFAPSDLVKSVTGVDNVCERSAALGSRNGKKILSKTSGSGCTCALTMRDWKCKF